MRILVAGAGVAGASFATLVARAGHEVTLVERRPRAEEMGYAVNLGKRALDALRAMGLLERIWEQRIPITTINTMDADGTSVRVDDLSLVKNVDERLGAYVDRSTLIAELRACLSNVDVQYEASLSAFEILGDSKVVARFADGGEQVFDALVIADGARSTLGRALLQNSGEEALGVEFAALRVPNTARVPTSAFNLLGVRRMCGVTGMSHDTVGLLMFWMQGELDIDPRKVAAEDLRRLFSEFGFSVPELLRHLTAETPIYGDAMTLVVRPTWSRGPVALLGDAAYCTSPLSTMGAATALVGAHVLASELAAASSLQEAYARYEKRMRPGVEDIQKKTRRSAKNLLSRTPSEARWRNRVLRYFPGGWMRELMVRTQGATIVDAL